MKQASSDAGTLLSSRRTRVVIAVRPYASDIGTLTPSAMSPGPNGQPDVLVTGVVGVRIESQSAELFENRGKLTIVTSLMTVAASVSALRRRYDRTEEIRRWRIALALARRRPKGDQMQRPAPRLQLRPRYARRDLALVEDADHVGEIQTRRFRRLRRRLTPAERDRRSAHLSAYEARQRRDHSERRASPAHRVAVS